MVKLEAFTEADAQKDPTEFFTPIMSDEVFNLKDAPYEDKVRFMRYCMNFTDLTNTSIITNIALLVYGTKITDDAFADERIVFNSLEEYVDAKFDLRKEIEACGQNLVMFFMGALKSYSVILPDGKIPIPSSYKVILMSSKIKDISKLMNRYMYSPDEVPLVYDADMVVDSFLFADCAPVQEFVSFVMEGLKDGARE